MVYTNINGKIYACEIVDSRMTIFGRKYLLRAEVHNFLLNKTDYNYTTKMWFNVWKTS